jgi:molybdate transport system substrate-binding protein
MQPEYVMGADVRAVLSYVESGNVDADIVYSTDALTSSKVEVVVSAPDAINAKVVYPAAALKTGKNMETAKSYIDFLKGPQAKTIFEKYGFLWRSKLIGFSKVEVCVFLTPHERYQV